MRRRCGRLLFLIDPNPRVVLVSELVVRVLALYAARQLPSPLGWRHCVGRHRTSGPIARKLVPWLSSLDRRLIKEACMSRRSRPVHQGAVAWTRCAWLQTRRGIAFGSWFQPAGMAHCRLFSAPGVGPRCNPRIDPRGLGEQRWPERTGGNRKRRSGSEAFQPRRPCFEFVLRQDFSSMRRRMVDSFVSPLF